MNNQDKTIIILVILLVVAVLLASGILFKGKAIKEEKECYEYATYCPPKVESCVNDFNISDGIWKYCYKCIYGVPISYYCHEDIMYMRWGGE